MARNRPIVSFIKVALNSPPLEQGPAGDELRHLLLALCQHERRRANDEVS